MPIESIIPLGWGDEFDDEKLLRKKETCMVEVCKDGKMDRTIGTIDIWYSSKDEDNEGFNVRIDNLEVNHVTRSGKGFKLAEKKAKKWRERKQIKRKQQKSKRMT